MLFKIEQDDLRLSVEVPVTDTSTDNLEQTSDFGSFVLYIYIERFYVFQH